MVLRPKCCKQPLQFGHKNFNFMDFYTLSWFLGLLLPLWSLKLNAFTAVNFCFMAVKISKYMKALKRKIEDLSPITCLVVEPDVGIGDLRLSGEIERHLVLHVPRIGSLHHALMFWRKMVPFLFRSCCFRFFKTVTNHLWLQRRRHSTKREREMERERVRDRRSPIERVREREMFGGAAALTKRWEERWKMMRVIGGERF